LQADLPELFGEAREAGATTSIDPNWDPAERWDGGLLALLSQTDYFLPNSAEAREITGIDDIDVASQSLAERGTTLAVKFGQGGGMIMADGESLHVEAVPVDVVDTTGAGDTFDAGFLAGCLKGWTAQRSLELAVACGSLSVQAAGGTDAQPTMDEALATLGEA
jgi:sugar/nucleoside kinase (ribokinase family)